MNENLDLVTILKDCPKGTKLYSAIYGDVTFYGVDNSQHVICTKEENGEFVSVSVTKDGKHLLGRGECVLFPSKDQRDWSKFKVPHEKFDVNTLQPFDKVLVRVYGEYWKAALYSHISATYVCTTQGWWQQCIPYNDDTKHLIGTNKDCPKYYKWW
jgi:hypothetical protein